MAPVEYLSVVAIQTSLRLARTRAGALAGVGLALDPEGNKSVLIQPSSLEKNTLYFTLS